MYIWRKRATAEWLSDRLDDLLDEFGGALAIIEQPGSPRSVVQISTTKKKGDHLVRESGGTLERLPTDWLQQYAKQSRTKPLRIGSRLTVEPTPGARNEKTIVIPAEAAFGTGQHATTAMCLRLVERMTRRWPHGWRMLDAGTGSGILAIGGARFGAGRVIAIENDPVASATAARNAKINRVSNIKLRVGDVLQQKLTGRFDLITANLYTEILIAALPAWRRHLTDDGLLILSGVLRSQERILLAALRRNRLAAREIKRRGKWIALLAEPIRKNS
ncbi:MAG: 50S ribosomal protein L11 methyltransferase [Chthoniobacterales bacterium]